MPDQKQQMTEEERKARNAEHQRKYRESQRNNPEYWERRHEYSRKFREKNAKKIAEKKRADYEKRKAEAPPKAPKVPKPKKQKKPTQPVSDPVVPASTHFPADSVIAAAINHKHGISTVLAVGQAEDSRQTVIIERHKTDKGFYLFRVKTTTYSYHKTKANALKAAKAAGLKLKLYDSFKELANEAEGGDPMIVEEIMNDIS